LRKTQLLVLLVNRHRVRPLDFYNALTFGISDPLAVWTNKSAFP
jgi:uncharacterized membrane protein